MIPSELYWSMEKDPWVPKGSSVVWEKGLILVTRLNSAAEDPEAPSGSPPGQNCLSSGV